MNKYLVTLRIGGQVVKTVVFADSSTHARLLCQYKYGMNSVVANPVVVNEENTLLDNTIKPIPPMTLAQGRIKALKQGVERSKEQLQAERDRQHRQREAERTRQQRKKRF